MIQDDETSPGRQGHYKAGRQAGIVRCITFWQLLWHRLGQTMITTKKNDAQMCVRTRVIPAQKSVSWQPITMTKKRPKKKISSKCLSVGYRASEERTWLGHRIIITKKRLKKTKSRCLNVDIHTMRGCTHHTPPPKKKERLAGDC